MKSQVMQKKESEMQPPPPHLIVSEANMLMLFSGFTFGALG